MITQEETLKRLALCALGLGLIPAAFCQDTGKTLVNEMVSHWESSKALSLAVAEAMPEDSYSFKATPAEMSFGGQMNHIASANAFYCSTAMSSKSPLGKAADDTKATATKNLTTAYDYCIDGLKEMTDADLQKTASMRGTPVSKFELFWGGFTHAAHHRGQAEVYLRLKDIKPPDYKF
jgi:uncharacterized damage-inducible protein DinB